MKKSSRKPVQERFDILKVTTEMVVRVYSGRPGCGCGCKGTYSESQRSKTIILNKLKKNPMLVEQTGPFARANEEQICFSLETESRYLWVFVPFNILKKECTI